MGPLWLIPALAGVIGLGLGWGATRWLRTLDYRYDDERHLPAPSVGWVTPVTTITAALLGVAWAQGRPAYALVVTILSGLLVTMAAIDLDVRRLPDALTKPSIPVTAALLGAAALVEGDASDWWRALAAGAALGGGYLLLVLIGGGEGMGMGDAKLAPTLGMLLGYLGWSHVFLGTFLGFLSGMVWGVWQATINGQGRHATLAFGPHMVIGTLLLLVLPGVGVVAGASS